MIVRAVLQRVSQARVLVDDEEVGSIGRGWLVLLGIGPSDDQTTATKMVDRIAHLRAFDDASGKMNLSALDVSAELLIVSQFTLYADTSRGRRPGFTGAAPPSIAEPLVGHCAELFRRRGLRVATGRFGTHMSVELVNNGPVTFVLDSEQWT